ncbi:MAG: hypothetical protein C0404_07050, partial [Verrucomicrobia bacterium]|nr:hypothetical protein [Verrucomicrobiota bacterium]
VRKRILFVGEGIALAHVARAAVLAGWAKEAGHDVSFACSERYADVACREGLEPIPLRTIDPALFFSRLSQGRFMFTVKDLKDYISGEIKLIGEVRPDLIVGDFRLTLPISAALSGIRCMSLLNSHLSPAAKRNLTAPEGGFFGLLPGPARRALFSTIRPLAYRLFAAPLDRVRRDLGLPTFSDFREHYSAGDCCAYLDLPEFAPVDHMPANHFYLGPVIWRPRGFALPALGALGLDRPLAYVTIGSTGDGGWLPKILESLLAMGCDMAVSGIGQTEAGELRRRLPALAGRSLMGRILDPTQILERAMLTVCHGGSGTVYQSLEASVPVLCFPSNADQRIVVQAVEASGTGLVGDGTRVGEQIAELIAGRCGAKTQWMASCIRCNDTRGRWLKFLTIESSPNHSMSAWPIRSFEWECASACAQEEGVRA